MRSGDRMRCHSSSRLQIVCILIVCGFAVTAVVIQSAPAGRVSWPLFVNTSDSLPLGLYRVTKVFDLQRGYVLRTCLPAEIGRAAVQRGYVRRGTCPNGSARVGKPIIALQGDTVVVSDGRIQVHGQGEHEAPIYAHDRRGRSLANAVGTHILQPGECFLLSTHSSFSYDSRYYGPIYCGEAPYFILVENGSRAP
ncbi:MAG: conjugative transfer signal peptidase TraF [Rhodothermaceae bacterium]|nr:conjugative transfer signal peptidase TraF [Rhodothermaceae bacterium]